MGVFARRQRHSDVFGALRNPCCEPLGGKLWLFFQPPCARDRNRGALAWNHLESGNAGRMAITGKEDFQRKVQSSMRKLQNDPEKIRSFYEKPSRKYAA